MKQKFNNKTKIINLQSLFFRFTLSLGNPLCSYIHTHCATKRQPLISRLSLLQCLGLTRDCYSMSNFTTFQLFQTQNDTNTYFGLSIIESRMCDQISMDTYTQNVSGSCQREWDGLSNENQSRSYVMVSILLICSIIVITIMLLHHQIPK